MSQFGEASLKSRAKLHPRLQKLVDAAVKRMDFKILDATRGRAAQERAVKNGNSKVHFGDSAHNYEPAIAADLFPAPYDWNNLEAFKTLAKIIKEEADKLDIPIRQGMDWNRNGTSTDEKFIDWPHVELHPWREWAKKSKLVED